MTPLGAHPFNTVSHCLPIKDTFDVGLVSSNSTNGHTIDTDRIHAGDANSVDSVIVVKDETFVRYN